MVVQRLMGVVQEGFLGSYLFADIGLAAFLLGRRCLVFVRRIGDGEAPVASSADRKPGRKRGCSFGRERASAPRRFLF